MLGRCLHHSLALTGYEYSRRIFVVILLLIIQKSAAHPPTRDHDDAMTVSWTLKLDYGVEVPLTLELL